METTPNKIDTKSFTNVSDKVVALAQQATGLVLGTNLFLYFVPNQANVAGMFMSEGEGGELMDGLGPSTMLMDVLFRGQFTKSADAQEFAMMVLSMTPTRDAAPIQFLNGKRNPKIGMEKIEIANGRTMYLFRVDVVLEVSWVALAPAVEPPA